MTVAVEAAHGLFVAATRWHAPALESAWAHLLRTFRPWDLYTWVFYLFLIAAYVFGGAFFALIDLLDLFPQYKIQTTRKPTRAEYWHCVRNIIQNYVFIIFPLSFGNYYLLQWMHVDYELEKLPPTWKIVQQLLSFFIIEDLFQYALHRLLHYGWLYRYVHKVHHHHPAPFGLTAAYAHWAEILVLAIPTYSGPALFAPHLVTMYLWILIRELDSVHTHCGYEFPFQTWANNWIPFYGGTPFHDYHHYSFKYNYASRITLIDKVFGTYKDLPKNELNARIISGMAPIAQEDVADDGKTSLSAGGKSSTAGGAVSTTAAAAAAAAPPPPSQTTSGASSVSVQNGGGGGQNLRHRFSNSTDGQR